MFITCKFCWCHKKFMIVSINLKKTKISNRTKLKASLCENRESSQQLTFGEHFYLKNKAITRLSKPKSKKYYRAEARWKGCIWNLTCHLELNLSARPPKKAGEKELLLIRLKLLCWQFRVKPWRASNFRVIFTALMSFIHLNSLSQVFEFVSVYFLGFLIFETDVVVFSWNRLILKTITAVWK